MKVCPKCGAVSNDDTQIFCLMDGAQLVADGSQPTIFMPNKDSVPTLAVTTPKRKRNPLLWVVLAIVILLIGGVALMALVLFSYHLGSESAKADKNGATSTANTASTPARSTPATSSSAEPSPPGSNSAVQDPNEVTPITWTTAAMGFKDEPGLTYRFQCPDNGTAGAVWGSDVYTTDSSICTAAVHTGKISLEKGGVVTIEFRPGRSIYGSTTRNGITTNTFGEYPHSFVFK